MNEEKQKILENFLNLEEPVKGSEYQEDLIILREAWHIEIDKPGCSSCIKNAAKGKYNSLAVSILEHGLSIEDSKKIHDIRVDLNKEHAEVQKKINDKINEEIASMKSSGSQNAQLEASESNSNSENASGEADSTDRFNPFL
jgi:hypothetical protein